MVVADFFFDFLEGVFIRAFLFFSEAFADDAVFNAPPFPFNGARLFLFAAFFVDLCFLTVFFDIDGLIDD